MFFIEHPKSLLVAHLAIVRPHQVCPKVVLFAMLLSVFLCKTNVENRKQETYKPPKKKAVVVRHPERSECVRSNPLNSNAVKE